MGRNDEPIEEPWVRAVVVPGDEPDTEGVDVMIAWDDMDDIAETALGLLPPLRDQLAAEPRFGGRVRFVLPVEFVGETPEVRAAAAALAERLREAAADATTASGRPWRIEVELGLQGGPR